MSSISNITKQYAKMKQKGGAGFFGIGDDEKNGVSAVCDIKKGEMFTKKNIRVIRPGFGIQPVYFEKLINKRSPFNIKRETPLNSSLLKKLKIFI